MDKQNLRFMLIAMLVLVGFSLFNKYFADPEKNIKKRASLAVNNEVAEVEQSSKSSSYNEIPNELLANKKLVVNTKELITKSLVTVDTDLLKVKINSHGDLIFAELKKYPQAAENPNKGFILLQEAFNRFYIVQSGLLSEIGPDSKMHGRGTFHVKNNHYFLHGKDEKVQVDLFYNNNSVDNGSIDIIKRFTFYKNNYVIKVEYIINNKSTVDYIGSMYGRLRRKEEHNNSSGSLFGLGGLKTYMGAAISTPEQKYKKISFANLKNTYKQSFNGGWIAMLEHYFVTAWLPDNVFSEYQTEQFNDNSCGIRFVNAPIKVAPGETIAVGAKLYLGPKIANILKNVSSGLELTIDYGVLWWLCAPLFSLLQSIFDIIGNWGWSIIFTTLIIKILFYKLSAAGYRSMGNLRKLQPKIEELKANYSEDRQKLSRAIMELYKKEKINPLGGCLPMLVQIPVFIALYCVLLESVELRQAKWCLWITDLSIKDPWYVLPILMGVSMLLQQKMNPPPADPIQAKVLMFMPIIFTVFFLQFPSGLMLYWIINNSLSILQQIFITKSLERQIVAPRSW